MPNPADVHEAILRACADATPALWYPSSFARESGVPRDDLDPILDRLRRAGLVRVADWTQGLGQGYALTPDGQLALADPEELARRLTTRVDPLILPEPRTPPALPPEGDPVRGEIVRQALAERPTPVVTFLLIAANLGVFFVGYFRAQAAGIPPRDYLGLGDIIRLDARLVEFQHSQGGIRADDIVRGEWWRLFTAFFVHFGILHVAMNMYALFAVGPLLEQMWGRVRFLILYVLAGLGGSCAMVVFTPNSIGAGASGAIWGLLTSLAAWIFLNRSYMPPGLASAWLRRLVMLIVLNSFLSMIPGISAAAHFTGGAVGLAASVFLNEQRFHTGLRRGLAAVGLLLLPVVSIGAVVRAERANPDWQHFEWEGHLVPQINERAVRFDEIWKKDIQPLVEHPEKGDPIENVRTIGRTWPGEVKILQDLDIFLTEAGPLNDPASEEARKQELDRIHQIWQRREHELVQKVLGPLARDAGREATRTYQADALPLMLRDPATWDTREVARAIASLNASRHKLDDFLAEFRAVPPFRTDSAEKKRRLELDLLETRDRYLQLVAARLQKGAAWGLADQKEMEEQRKKLRDLEGA